MIKWHEWSRLFNILNNKVAFILVFCTFEIFLFHFWKKKFSFLKIIGTFDIKFALLRSFKNDKKWKMYVSKKLALLTNKFILLRYEYLHFWQIKIKDEKIVIFPKPQIFNLSKVQIYFSKVQIFFLIPKILFFENKPCILDKMSNFLHTSQHHKHQATCLQGSLFVSQLTNCYVSKKKIPLLRKYKFFCQIF